MENTNYLTPKEITDYVVHSGETKTHTLWWKQILLGFLGGVFIAFAAEGSSVSSYGIHITGLAKTLAGAIFSTGLMMVLLAGADLFTGNCLIIVSVIEKKSTITGMLRNWVFVYLGNLLGSLFIAFLILHSSQLNMDAGMLGGYVVKNATLKCNLSFTQALSMGILCNWLVCIAVWLCYGAKDMAGKILAIFFPIWLFITSGFEHSVADMYYIAIGLFAKSNETYTKLAMEDFHITADQLQNLTWTNYFTKSLIPVTLGNIIGGVIFVGCIYWLIYKKDGKNK